MGREGKGQDKTGRGGEGREEKGGQETPCLSHTLFSSFRRLCQHQLGFLY